MRPETRHALTSDGVSVHIGVRIAAMAGPGEVLVSRTVRDLAVGSGLIFEDRGLHRKGVPEAWQVLAASDGTEASRQPLHATATRLVNR